MKEICQERAEQRQHVQKKTDSLNYPTYGRGLEPNPNIDSYMINESLCGENSGGKKKAVAGNVAGEANGSPMKKPKQKRPKIISPSRRGYETNFEAYFIEKHLKIKLEEEKEKEVNSSESEEEHKGTTLITETPFDVITKTTGSINKKVIDRQRKSVERANRKMLKKKTTK